MEVNKIIQLILEEISSIYLLKIINLKNKKIKYILNFNIYFNINIILFNSMRSI